MARHFISPRRCAPAQFTFTFSLLGALGHKDHAMFLSVPFTLSDISCLPSITYSPSPDRPACSQQITTTHRPFPSLLTTSAFSIKKQPASFRYVVSIFETTKTHVRHMYLDFFFLSICRIGGHNWFFLDVPICRSMVQTYCLLHKCWLRMAGGIRVDQKKRACYPSFSCPQSAVITSISTISLLVVGMDISLDINPKSRQQVQDTVQQRPTLLLIGRRDFLGVEMV